MKEPSDSEQPNTVVSIIDFRNKRTIKLPVDSQDASPSWDSLLDGTHSLLGDDNVGSLNPEWLKNITDLLNTAMTEGDKENDFLQKSHGEENYDDLDVAIPRVEFVRMQTILAVLDDALQSLYHCHAVVTSDKMWQASETIRNQMAQMTLYADKYTKK